jgi:hypothetical protein
MKIPFNEAETLNYIAREEAMELSWLDRQLGIRRPTILSTEDLAKQYKKPIDTQNESVIFKPFKLNFIFLSIAGVIFIGLMINVLLNPKPNENFNVFIPFLIVLMVVGFIGIIFDKKRNFKIVLSKEGIAIKEFNYQWKEIYKIYIVKRREGKGYTYYLILALDTGVTDRYDFTNLIELRATEKKLSAYIEHYKKIA